MQRTSSARGGAGEEWTARIGQPLYFCQAPNGYSSQTAAWVNSGGPVAGGKVYGRWPGLAREQLYEERDLALTTDFRAVLGEILARHLRHDNLQTVFPGFHNDPRNFPGVMRT